MNYQEQYPNFYPSTGGKPHLWIDAIEVEVKERFIIGGRYALYFNQGERHVLTQRFLAEMLQLDKLQFVAPLFKPQEGEAFLKDLKEAVSAMGATYTNPPQRFYFDSEDEFNYYFVDFKGAWAKSTVVISKRDISEVKAHDDDGDYYGFKTAAYVDTMRDKGYYL